MKTDPMKDFRARLKQTVLDECRNRKTSRKIAEAFLKRHRRATDRVANLLVTAQIIKHIDDIKHIGRRRANPQQLELFEDLVADIIRFPVIEKGKRVRTEIRS